MSWKTIMFAVPSPIDIGLIEADKVAGIAAVLDAQLQLFHCVFDASMAHPGKLAPASAEEPIHQLVLNAQQGLERIAERLRARGLQVDTSVRWDDPAHEGIVRQALRHEPALLIARSHHQERAAGLPAHTDWKLIETCPCPLLLLKSPSPYAKPLVIAAVAHTHARQAGRARRALTRLGRSPDRRPFGKSRGISRTHPLGGSHSSGSGAARPPGIP